MGLAGVILLLQDVGFSLRVQGLSCVTAQAADGWRTHPRKPARLDEQIAKAQTAKEALTHALHCPHDDITTCANVANVIAARLAAQAPGGSAPTLVSREDLLPRRARWLCALT